MGIERGKPQISSKERLEGFKIQFAMRDQIAKTDSREVEMQLEDAKTPEQVRAILPSYDRVKREEGRTTGDEDWLEALNVPGMTDTLKEKIIDRLQHTRYLSPETQQDRHPNPSTELDLELARVLGGEPANAEDEINGYYLQIERDAKRLATNLGKLGQEVIPYLGEQGEPAFVETIIVAKRMGQNEERFKNLQAMDEHPDIAPDTVVEVLKKKNGE